MDLRSKDYYEILGVARGADEREVKRAYFKLVRKFSPETHPEEFKRVREAYEILSNSVSRKDYDGLTQWGDEIGARMKAGSAAMERADYKAAQAEFKHVLVLQPQLAFARDLLGMAYLNANQAREALVQFDLLVSQQPNNSIYHLHKGYAHYALQQYAQATVAYQRALEIDPADNRVRIALADVYSDTEQYDAALVELDKAIHQDGEVNFQDFVFMMRKVQIQLLRNRPELAETELDEIFKILPSDGETRKYVATKISALAAQLFRMKRSADANRMLARAKQLDNSRKSLELQFPAKSSIPIHELPAASQTVLAGMKKNWTASKITHKALVGPTFLMIGASLLGLIGLWSTLGSETLWVDEAKFFMFLVIVGTPLLTALAIRRIRRVTASPFGKFTEVTPLYLIQSDIDKLNVWPLPNLHDVALTHHLQNGSYQSTTVRMDFAGVPLTISIRGQQAAVDWAQHLLDTRHRSLSLLAEGLLDQEEGIDFIPPSLLAGARNQPKKNDTKRTLITYGASLAGGLALFYGAALPLNTFNSEAGDWHAATGYSASIASYKHYLERYPNGRHAENARDAIKAHYDDAKSSLLNHPDAGDGAKVVADLIDQARTSETHNLRMTYKPLDGSDSYLNDAAFTSSFKTGIGGAVPSEVLSFNEYGSDGTIGGFELAYKIHSPVEKTMTSRERSAALRDGVGLGYTTTVDFDFSILVGGLDKYHLKKKLTRDFVCNESLGETISSCQRQALDQLFDSMGNSVATDLGFTWSTMPISESRPSTYGRDRYGNGYFNTGDPSEDMRRIQQLLDDLNRTGGLNKHNGW
jgi:curved DNA-binding protein CbpA